MTEHVKIYGVIPKKQYIANGTTTTYEFPFAIFSSNDIEIYLNETKQSSTTYTVSGVRDSDGGTVTFTTAPENGTIITIMRHLSIERASDFQEGGALRADTLNDELDYQIACTQQIAENLNRSMVLPPYAVSDNVDLTLPTPSAGKAIVWNSDGTNLENSTVSVNALESTLNGYKTAAETAATTATTKAGIASDKADIATAKAQIATEKAAEATAAAANKANTDLDNLTATGKTTISNLSMPSNEYVDITTTTSSTALITDYEVPANGYIFVNAKPNTASRQGVIKVASALPSADNQIYQVGSNYPGSYCDMVLVAPVKKGNFVTVATNATGWTSVAYARFIYAEGEV